jgi:small-conductance mechanosensitive channel
MMEASPNSLQELIYAAMPWITLIGVMPWMEIIVQIMLALLGVFIFHRIGTRILHRVAEPFPFWRRLVWYGHQAGRAIVFFILMQIILRTAPDTLPGILLARHIGALCLTAALTWFGVRCVAAVADTIQELNPLHDKNNLEARRIHTHARVMARSIMIIVVVIGSGAALMTLPLLRQVGTSLLASAGVAGVVIGLAAKPVLTNLLAGLQIAMTQPIRLDDVVIVENEWGWIEEITTTYVVVRIWDQRRLVMPLQWFIEHPFQNWTRSNSEILGTVLLWLDYRIPVDLIRQQAQRICQSAAEWDGRVCQTQVIEAGQQAVQLRILVSAADAGMAWDLRCKLREELIHFIQRDYPEYLPRVRAELSGPESPPLKEGSKDNLGDRSGAP